MTSITVRIALSVTCLTILQLVWVLVVLAGFHAKIPFVYLWNPMLLAVVPGLVVGVIGLLISPLRHPSGRRSSGGGGAVVYVSLMGVLLIWFSIVGKVLIWGPEKF